MRVIVDIRPWCDPQRSGVGTYAAEITKALARRGSCELALFANGRGLAVPSDVPPGSSGLPHITRKFSHWPNRLLNAAFVFARRPLVETLAGAADALFLPNFGFFATRLPYVITVHDLSFIRYPEYFSRRQRLWHRAVRPAATLRGAAAVIAVSEHTRRDVIETFGVAPERVHVVTPAAGPEFVPQSAEAVRAVREKYDLRAPYFLFLGTLEPRKNVAGIIAAFDALCAGGSAGDTELVIAGGRGWLNADVYRKAAQSPNRSRIRFLGYAAHADKPALYGGALALVYPSFYEGFGMPPLEAMRCGTPVIASHTSSLGEVVGNAGLLVDPDSVADISAAMGRMLTERGLAATLRARGLERARRFSWDASAAVIERMLSRLAR